MALWNACVYFRVREGWQQRKGLERGEGKGHWRRWWKHQGWGHFRALWKEVANNHPHLHLGSRIPWTGQRGLVRRREGLFCLLRASPCSSPPATLVSLLQCGNWCKLEENAERTRYCRCCQGFGARLLLTWSSYLGVKGFFSLNCYGCFPS